MAEVPLAVTDTVDGYDATASDGSGGAVQQQPAGSVRVIELALAMLTALLVLGAWLARRNA